MLQPFKRNDMVKLEILRTTKVAGELVTPGDIVEVLGNIAFQLINGANPAAKQCEGDSVRKFVPREEAIIIEKRDPEPENREADIEFSSKKAAPKKK